MIAIGEFHGIHPAHRPIIATGTLARAAGAGALRPSLEPRTALVLGGGARLAAMQVGMLRALYERGITPDRVMSAFAFKPCRLSLRRGGDRPGGRGGDDPVAHRPVIGKRLATAALLAALSVSLLLSVPGLRPVVRAIGEISPSWVALAIALELASCFSFVIIFRLFFDRIKGRDARQLAWTSMASGALLPGGGVGGYAIGGWLAHLTGAPTPWIVRRSSGLFFLTSGVNSSAVIGAGLLLVGGLRGPHDFGRSALPVLLAAAATVVLLALPWIERRRRTPSATLEGIAVGIEDAVRAGLHPSWRLVGALGYLGFDIAVLWVSLTAVGTPLPLPALILGYSIGYLANSIPVPGGIGVLDAGLAGALLLYGASPVHVVAAVLVYHAIAFWIPSLGGLIAYARLRPRLMAPGSEDASLMPSSSKIGTPS